MYSHSLPIALHVVTVFITFFFVVLDTFFRHYFLVAFYVCRCSRYSNSWLLFTLVITLSTRYSHCLLSGHYFLLFLFDDIQVSTDKVR